MMTIRHLEHLPRCHVSLKERLTRFLSSLNLEATTTFFDYRTVLTFATSLLQLTFQLLHASTKHRISRICYTSPYWMARRYTYDVTAWHCSLSLAQYATLTSSTAGRDIPLQAAPYDYDSTANSFSITLCALRTGVQAPKDGKYVCYMNADDGCMRATSFATLCLQGSLFLSLQILRYSRNGVLRPRPGGRSFPTQGTAWPRRSRRELRPAVLSVNYALCAVHCSVVDWMG